MDPQVLCGRQLRNQHQGRFRPNISAAGGAETVTAVGRHPRDTASAGVLARLMQEAGQHVTPKLASCGPGFGDGGARSRYGPPGVCFAHVQLQYLPEIASLLTRGEQQCERKAAWRYRCQRDINKMFTVCAPFVSTRVYIK